MLTRLALSLTVLCLIAGCGTAPTPIPTPTATPPPSPTNTPAPTATAAPTNTPGPTITVVVPSSFGGSALQSRLAFADEDMCPGAVPREFVLAAQRSDDLDMKLACLARLETREAPAGVQQRTLYARGDCETPPGEVTVSRQNVRISEIWALDDLAQGYLIVAEGLAEADEDALARAAYQTVIDHYSCAWAYDIEMSRYSSAVAAAQAGLAALGG